jgi:hypothetical protein
MSWNTYYQRKSVIDAVLAEVTRTGTDEIPAERHAEITEVFGGRDEFLLALHYAWSNTLHARLDSVVGETPDEAAAKVRQAWETLAAERPAAISLLARYSGRPALADAMRHLQRRLAWAPGVDVVMLTKSCGEAVRVAA